MPAIVRAKCGACGAGLRLPDEWVGLKVRCKMCRSKLLSRRKPTVPADPVAAAPSAPAPASVAPPPAPPSEPAPWLETGSADNHFSFDGLPEPTGLPVGERLRSEGWTTGAIAAMLLIVLGLGAIGGSAYLFRDRLQTLLAGGTGKPTEAAPPPVAAVAGPIDLPGAAGPFPRRMLAVAVHNYLYLNPATDPPGAYGLKSWVNRVGERLRIPEQQTYIVSDTVTGPGSSPPVRPVIEQTFERFLATNRPEDRALLLFSGHMAMIDGKAYLVPLDGELTAPGTLIPLAWLYDRLATCPAREKLLILDVCRYDPDRGRERPGADPMSPELEKAIAAVPPGVRVWASCSAGQHSYEFQYANLDQQEIEGGLFLAQFFRAFQRGGMGIPKPEDALPIDALSEAVNSATSRFADGYVRRPQTPKIYGSKAEVEVTASGSPPPARFSLPSPDRLAKGGVADAQSLAALVDEIRLPSIKAVAVEELTYAERVDQLFPYSAEVMKRYADDVTPAEVLADPEKYPLRSAVLKTIDMLRRHARGEVVIGQSTKSVGGLMMEFRGQANDRVKQDLAREQEAGPALMYAELIQYLKMLESMAELREAEPSKRWQAHYDYALAMLKARFVYINEYNLALGKIRKDELPDLDEKLHNGWRLASSDRLQSPGDVKEQFKDSRKLLDQIVKEHPGTPWEVLAKRERLNVLGLSWQPSSLKN